MATKTGDMASDQRAEDQDAAMEAAFVAGTLPEEDRREAADKLLGSLPAGSRAIWADGVWNVYRGPGLNAHGVGKSLARAILAINAHQDIDANGTVVMVTESGDVLPPE